MNPPPLIAITMGDPAGIVPEVVAKSLTHPELPQARYVVVGDGAAMRHALDAIGSSAPVDAASRFEDISFPSDAIAVLEPESIDISGVQIGKV